MIRALVKRAARPDLVLLGLSRGNIDRLVAGRPILVEGAELGLDCDVSVLFAETEAALAAELREAGFDIPQITEPGSGESRRLA